MTNYESGADAYSRFRACSHFAGYDPFLDGAVGIGLFLPPETQSMMQISTPPDPARADWVRGWNDARDESRKTDKPIS